jgi:hypothetical protein
LIPARLRAGWATPADGAPRTTMEADVHGMADGVGSDGSGDFRGGPGDHGGGTSGLDARPWKWMVKAALASLGIIPVSSIFGGWAAFPSK